MSIFTAVPKTLKRLTKLHKYNSISEQSIGLHYAPAGAFNKYILLSKSKETGVYGMKIDMTPSSTLQKEVDREAFHILETLGSFADWAREGAMSGGTLYRIWPRFIKSGGKTKYLHPQNESNAKIEAAMKKIIKIADQKLG
jgi:hypothetical protein